MIVTQLTVPGVLLIEPDVFGDQRGFFQELWNLDRYREFGITDHFVQANVSRSRRGVLRGLHYQWPEPQSKLVYVLEGEVFDVAVDVRQDSPTFGHWAGSRLSADNHRQMYVPEGFAHGFCVLSETALFCYHCGAPYRREYDRAIRFDDPAIGVDWPLADPAVSAKDAQAPRLNEAEHLP